MSKKHDHLRSLLGRLFCLAAALFSVFASPVFLSGATLPAGFSETVIPPNQGGTWNEAVGLAFDNVGRMFVWERGGSVWFKDPGETSFSLLLSLNEEVSAYQDHGLLGFALDPNFRQNGYIYLLYAVDRHHLLNFGTPNYDSTTNEYNAASIGRLARYQCRVSDNFRSVDLSSRTILIGATRQTGIPILCVSHGVGSLVFGTDGTLLVSCGDGASPFTADVGGAAFGSFAPQGLADGIIRPKEDIGAFRSQLVDSLNGKILRIDPVTGNGLPSNPFYDSAAPASARSRVWALGLRNPFRMTLRPETGSHSPAAGNPGILYVGDVGWDAWESLKVVTAPGQNFGWPIYEGLALMPLYDQPILNQDAPNPAFPASGCSRYFSFKDLLHEDSLDTSTLPPFANPCNPSQLIPSSIPQFRHSRPALDWHHANQVTRAPIFDGAGQAATALIGDPGSPVTGTPFKGNCSIGGTWYTGTNFPAQYHDTYFHGDWGQAVVKNMSFGGGEQATAVREFSSNGGAVVCIVQHPLDGTLYYISFNYGGSGTIRQVAFTGNRSPVAEASVDKTFGPAPLTVQFSGSDSFDPDGGPLSFLWDFGDGSPTSTETNPTHTFLAPAGVPTRYSVSLTVTDSGGLSNQTTLIISPNNTPPSVQINSPVDGSLYSPTAGGNLNLSATVSDNESSDGQLIYQWQTILHHNDHNHGSPPDTNHVSTTTLSPTACDGINIYYYRILLTVTDPQGLSTTREVKLFPDCGSNSPPTISDIGSQIIFQDRSTGPIGFVVGDAETAAVNLQLSAHSSNPALVADTSIVFGGAGSNRTVNISPLRGQTGSAAITVSVTDGPLTTSRTFNVEVRPPPSGTASFTNSTQIAIPDMGASTPYPSYIDVMGLGGTTTNLTVTLRDLYHTWTRDISVLLVGPGGQKTLLMGNAGNGLANLATLTFSDSAASALPLTALVTGTYRPADYPPADVFPAPAPAGPYPVTLSGFNGSSPNGRWSLYVYDDGPGDWGSFGTGWYLTVSTSGAPGDRPALTPIPDQTMTVNGSLPPVSFSVTDAQTGASNLVLSVRSSNPTLLPTNGLVFGGSDANRTLTITPQPNQIGSSAITVSVSDGLLSSSNTFTLTVNPVPLTVDVQSASRSYGAINPAFAGTLTGLQSGSDITLGLSSSATPLSPLGDYPIQVTLNDPSNRLGIYQVTTNSGVLTVAPAPLQVTASDRQKHFASADPAFAVSYAGFANGEDASVLGGTLQFTRAPGEDVGDYAIWPSGLISGNYNLTYSPGTLSIVPALVTGSVTASANPAVPSTPLGLTYSLSVPGVPTAKPGGSVRFKVDGSLAGQAILNNGIATLTTTNIPAGEHTVVAEYDGEANFSGATNALPVTLLVNTPPVPASILVERESGNGVKISVSNLLGKGNDAEGDPLAFAGFTTNSSQGGTVTLIDGWLSYLPPAQLEDSDTFTYQVSDGRGEPVSGTITIVVGTDSEPSQNLLVTPDGAGSYSIRFSGIPGRAYRIESSDSPTGPLWQQLGTATANGFGEFEFHDTPPPGSPTPYYRSAKP